jgi:hypothetical protein
MRTLPAEHLRGLEERRLEVALEQRRGGHGHRLSAKNGRVSDLFRKVVLRVVGVIR